MLRTTTITMMLGCLLLAGCAQKMTMKVADGTEQTFKFRNGEPLPNQNAWGRVLTAGLTTGIDNGKVAGWQEYAFSTNVSDLVAVTVFDVTQDEPVLLIDDRDVTLVHGEWRARTASKPIGSRYMPWALDGKTDLFIYKFVLENAAGESGALYQPAVYNGQFDAAVKRMFESPTTKTAAAQQPADKPRQAAAQ